MIKTSLVAAHLPLNHSIIGHQVQDLDKSAFVSLALVYLRSLGLKVTTKFNLEPFKFGIVYTSASSTLLGYRKERGLQSP